jgi:peptide/nickel transport system substrate-binding protein
MDKVKKALVLFVLMVAGTILFAQSASKKDMVVMAWQIDDIITFDPGEVYELSGMEMVSNIYDRLVYFPVDKIDDPQPGIAEKWTVSPDGMTFTFTIRKNVKFHSGNVLSADDAAWSIQRAIKMNKGPAIIITDLGFTPENVDAMVTAPNPTTLVVKVAKKFAPSYVINTLGSGVGSVVDKKTVLAHEVNGDFGNAWLKSADAGSGPFKLNTWKPNELVILDSFPDYWRGPSKIKKVALKHVPDSAAQRLMLEKGDIDVARSLNPQDILAVTANKNVNVRSVAQGAITYLGLNQKNQYLSKPEVREALKWLVDYDSIQKNIVNGTKIVHQTFLPENTFGAIADKPYSYNLEKAKALLAKAGLPNGFKVTIDTTNSFPTNVVAQAIQANFAKAGIELEIIPGDNKQTLTKYRARTHDIYIGRWSPDYADPHSNTGGFAVNLDNTDATSSKTLAWRNAWDIPELSKKAAAALEESDTAKRKKMYSDLQKELLKDSPFVILFQDISVVAERKNMSGFAVGPSSDYVYYRDISFK